MDMRPPIGAVVLAVAFATSASACPVSDLSQGWAGYWNAKNLPGVLKLYAEDAVFLPDSGERWEGLRSIKRNFAKVQAKFSADLHLTSHVCEASGSLAYDSGSFTETLLPVKGGAELRLRGQYLFVFQRDHGRGWKILEQTFTQAGTVKP